ncbi:MAG: hypothetical protein IPM35_24880 [Myxococcales bacterium]|nr:hypothetical protein [Myxococcales bacterium]
MAQGGMVDRWSDYRTMEVGDIWSTRRRHHHQHYLWWNYLHASLERIDVAKADWRNGRVKLFHGDTESFTPCPPDEGRPLVRHNGG